MTPQLVGAVRESQEWYAATLLFASEIGDIPSLRSLCEERVVLFRTGNSSAAMAAAREYGANEEHAYPNSMGELVRWRFVGVEKVEQLLPLTDAGWEVASRFTRRTRRTLTALTEGNGLPRPSVAS